MSWPSVKLGEIAPSKPIRANRYSADDHVWQITLDHVEANTGVLLEKSIRPYCEAGSSTHGFDDRYVLYSKLRPYLNKVLLPDEDGVCTTELVPMLPNPKTLDRNYLAHYLKSKEFVNWISAQTAGAKMPRVSMDVFWNHEIPLPPLEEQKRIAAILDKADAIRRKRQQAIKLTDDFLRSVFLEMFGDPVTNPKGWEVKKLGDVAELINGDRSSNYPSGDDLKESGILFLNTKNITDGKIELVDPVFITEEKFSSLSRGKLQRYDLVITLRGTLGSCAIFNAEYETGFINAQLMIIRPKVGITSDFLHAYLTSDQIQDVLQSLGRGAAVPQLTGAQMKDLDVYIPNVELLDKFTKIKNTVSNIKLKCNVAEKAELFESLSKKAFSGMI